MGCTSDLSSVWVDAYKYKDAEVQYYSYLAKHPDTTNNHNHLPPPAKTSKRNKNAKNLKNKEPANTTPSDPKETPINNAGASQPQGDVKEVPTKKKNKKSKAGTNSNETRDSLTCQVQKVRQQLHDSLKLVANDAPSGLKVLSEQSFNAAIDKIHQSISAIEARLSKLELSASTVAPAAQKPVPQKPAAKVPTPAKKAEPEEDDDVDLFGSDSEGEDEAAAKIREERLAAYAAKKGKKPALIAKSNIIFDVKPWDDETDMKQLEAVVRSVEHDGLLWGTSKLMPLAYGIHKLQISSVIEDDKVSVDWLQETIEERGQEFVQSVDIAAFNKV